MLDNLSASFDTIISRVRGFSRLTEENISSTCDMIRDTLIDADVAVEVAEEFVAKVKTQALGQKIIASLRPSQAMIAMVQEELTYLMGEQASPLASRADEPGVILLCGLQGSGKTTTTAKLALLLGKQKKRVLACSTDVRRPAAIEQLRILCEQIKVDFHEPGDEAARQDPIRRAKLALDAAGQTLCDYLLVDTAGRNVIDDQMMAEIDALATEVPPCESLLVIDSTQGQQALRVAEEFNRKVAITGIFLTKLDGDARGGAAMSARASLGVPVKYIGVGEKPEDIEAFDPARMASRILGMGDIVALVEKTKAEMGQKKVASLERKLRRKKKVSLELGDMIEQMRQADKMGGLDKLTDHLPSSMNAKIKQANIDPRIFRQMEAIYLSMTRFERKNPHLLKGSRKARIAAGAGVQIQQVNQLLSQHAQAQKFMRKAAKNPLAAMGMMRQLMR